MPEKSVNDLPRDLRPLHTKGMDALQRENWDYAIALFMQILEKEPQAFDSRRALREAQMGKSGAKGGFFKRAFSSASSSPMVAKGQMALRKNPVEAMQIAEQILNGDVNNGAAHKLLAEAALALEMPRTAVLSLEIVYRNAPKDKEAGMKLAEALDLAGEPKRAEKIYEELRTNFPNDNEVFMALKNHSARDTMDKGGYNALASGQGSYRDILKDKEQSVRLEQENRQVKASDTTEELLKDWETRLAAEPNNLKMLRNLAETYSQRNEFDRALGYYERMSAIDGGVDSALAKQIADLKVKRFSHALANLDPAAPDYADKAGQIKSERRAFQLEECKARVERYPTDLQIRFELGLLYFEADRIGEAIPEFQKALNSPHRKTQAASYLAKCWERRGMNDLAAKKLAEVLKEKLIFDEEKKDLIYTLAGILEKMNKKEEAIEQLKLIYEVDSAYRDVAAKVEAYYAGGG